MLTLFITILHILACIFLVMVVLLQTGKGAEVGAVFGGSSSTVFGSSGAGNFLTKLTTATAVLFMLTSLSLTYLAAQGRTATIVDTGPVTEQAPDQASNNQAEVPPASEVGDSPATTKNVETSAQDVPPPVPLPDKPDGTSAPELPAPADQALPASKAATD